MDFKKIIKCFIGGAVAGAIGVFFIKLYFGTQWDWDSDDLYSLIGFGFAGFGFAGTVFSPTLKKKK